MPSAADRRVLVLGATGFIGRHVVGELLENPSLGFPLPACRTVPFSERRLGDIEWIRIDILGESEASLRAALEDLRPDVVVNCIGATTGPRRLLRDANVGVPLKLVRVLAGGLPSQLVHIGSAAEYGPHPRGQAVHEQSRPQPLTDYGSTKLAGTEIVRRAAEDGAVNATVLRVFNPIGAFAPSSMLVGRAVEALRSAIRSDATEIVMGPLDSMLDYVDVRDVARAALMVPDGGRQLKFPPVVNVGRGQARSSRWVVNRLAAASGFEGSVIEEDAGSSRSDRLRWQAADVTAARLYMGWEPLHPLSESVANAWRSSLGAVLDSSAVGRT